MLFAAGFGTRMRPLTDDRPKPLIEVGGRCLLDHALAQADLPAISTRLVNGHYLGDQMAAAAATRGLEFAREDPDILDTGGGLKSALPRLGAGDAVFALNTDAVWTGPKALETLANAWDPARMDGLLLLCPTDRAVGHTLTSGFAMDDQGRLSRGPVFAYTGAQILKKAPIAAEPAQVFSLNRTWDAILPTGRLFGVLHPGYWCDVGHPGGITLAETMMAAHV